MKRVLVADDKATGRELIRTVLEQCGYSVFEAGDGIEAVRKARKLLRNTRKLWPARPLTQPDACLIVRIRSAQRGARVKAGRVFLRSLAPRPAALALLSDLIILDLHMPQLDGFGAGFGACHEIRADERFRAAPIVALTVSAMRSDRERALLLGFTSYLAKPIALTVLQSEVARLMGKETSYAGSH